MLLLIDNYDSFTYNLTDYFKQLGEELVVVKNDEMDKESIKALAFDRLVISPGPGRPENAGQLMEILDASVLRVPILGICLGHQAIGCYFGAELTHAPRPMHGKVSTITHNGKGIYSNLPQHMKVCRYHSLVLENIDTNQFEIDARSEDGVCMSMSHKKLPITGIQYHPEAILTEGGLKLLENWLRLTDVLVS